MKQSTKLLSLVLALVMAFSCMSVVGNAVTTFTAPEHLAYDCIDDANLTPEQVADIALDLVDGLLADLNIQFGVDAINFEVDLRSVDRTFETLSDVANGGLFAVASAFVDLGALEDLDYSALGDPGYQRSGGNLRIIYQLVQFLYDNRNVLKNITNGINNSGGIELGIIGNFVDLDVGEINAILMNLPGFALDMLYDLLVHGSYAGDVTDSKGQPYPNESYPSAEEIKEAGLAMPYTDVDVMLNNAILNLLIKPQSYEWVPIKDADDKPTGEDEKVWDLDSIVVPSMKAYVDTNGRDKAIENFDLTQKSVFDILDFAAQWAIDDLGVNALNHNLKKNLMEAVEVEFNTVLETSVPADVMEIFTAEEYVTYIGYDCLEKSKVDGCWYYTTFENVPADVDENGEQDIDPDTLEPLTVRDHVYYKANTANVNEFYYLINWDYEIVRSDSKDAHTEVWTDDKGVQQGPNTINYDYILAKNGGSLVESLNHIVYIVFETALLPEVKEDFAAVTGNQWLDGKTSVRINDNIGRLAKYLLATFPDRIFGGDSVYANGEYDYAFYKDMTLIDIVALIGPSFFDGVMPQLIIPKDANGAYAFSKSANGESVALLEFAALVIREFMTEIAPNVNYDAAIFGDTITAKTGRQFAKHSSEEWFNIILNMGTDIAGTYLSQITNFKDYCAEVFGTSFDLNAYLAAGGGTDPSHWNATLDTAIEWAVDYVSGSSSSSVLKGISLDALHKYGSIKDGNAVANSSLKKLSLILHTLLPLGFINGLEDAEFDVSAEVLVNRLKGLLTTFDLTNLTGLFGRNGVPGVDTDANGSASTLKRGNILAKPAIPMVLELVNDIVELVLGGGLLPSETSVQSNLTNAQIQTILVTVLTNLNNIKGTLLPAALPVVGKLIKGWGTEQSFGAPSMDVDAYVQTNGAGEMKDGDGNNYDNEGYITNGADGVWRSYVDANGQRQFDKQYAVELVSVAAYNFDGSPATDIDVSLSNTTGKNGTGYLDFGETGTFRFTTKAQIPSPGKVVRFEITYKAYEGTTPISDQTFKTSSYVFFDYHNSSDEGTMKDFYSDPEDWGFWAKTYTPQFIDIAGDVKAQIADVPVYGMDKDNTTKTTGAQVDGTITGTSVHGLKVGTMNFYFNNGDRQFLDVKAFTSGTLTATGDKAESGDTANIDGSFDYNEWLTYNLESGDESVFTITATVARYQKIISTKLKGTDTATNTFKLLYWSSADQQVLRSGTEKEAALGKVKTDYNLTEAYYLADSYLNPNPTEVVDGEEVKRETNFTDTAWVNSKGEEVTGVTEDDKDTTIGKYTDANGVEQEAYKVTKIVPGTAWTNYENAFKAAMESGLGIMRSDRNRRYLDLLENLQVASNDLKYVERANTSADLDTEIGYLKSELKDVETNYTDNYDYTDYRMYRLNRLNDARDDAQYYIDLMKDSKRAITDIDSTFPYTWIEEDDLRKLVEANTALQAAKDDGNDKTEDNLVLALLDELTAEEKAEKAEWLENRIVEYASTNLLDVKLARSLLNKTSNRLIKREYVQANSGKAVVTHLANEVASAEAMIPAANEELYTERSWVKYEKALADAKAVLANPTQKTVFDAKWELLCCRNELVLKHDVDGLWNEADYSELEALIDQAKWALAHKDLYLNTAEELGQVLAELGLEAEIKNADGDTIELFPGNALYINSEPYSKDEQGAIDQAANELKEALARLKFNELAVTGNEGEVAIEEAATIVFNDPDTEEDETVTARLATIAAGLSEDAVKGLFNVTADGIFEDDNVLAPENIVVSGDLHYSVEKYERDPETNEVIDLLPYEGFVGTNAVVTFYTVDGGVKIPVATVKIIVKGDINGDGTVDVIDATQLKLVSTDSETKLDGCYFIAGNLAGATDTKRVIDGDDYTAMINTVLGCKTVA